MNANELDNNFLESLKAAFPDIDQSKVLGQRAAVKEFKDLVNYLERS